MSVCRNAAPPSGIPAVMLPTVPGRARSLPVMSVNGVKPGKDGDVKLSVLEVVAPSADPSAEGKAADALATGRALDDVYRKGEVDRMVAEAVPDGYDEVRGQVRRNADALDILEGLVPPQASASNQLADKAFVNSSIATSTATFRGTFNLVTDLGLPPDATHAQVAAAVKARLGQADYDGSDYVFVQIPQDIGHPDAMKQVDRYKCVETGTDPVVRSWEYEWTLNNSSFTAAQWAAIVSGITSGGVAKLGGIEAGAQVNVIETVKVNGTALAPQDKAVDIPVPVLDDTVTPTSENGVKSSGIWSALWGALAALPTGFTSLYDWCVSQLAGKASKSDVDPLLFAQYYPDGSVKSAAEFTPGIKYGSFDDVHRTVSVLPFCNTGIAANDNSNLSDRVVIPPFVDGDGNPYISDDGTRYKVVGVSNGASIDPNADLTAIVAPDTVTTIGGAAFSFCTALASVSLPAATNIESGAFSFCTALASVSLPAATNIESGAFYSCSSLASVSLPAATTIGDYAFSSCDALASVDFGDTPRSDVPSLGEDALYVPTACKIIVPYTQYDAWIAADGWRDLPQEFVRHAEKADKPATFTAGNLAALDASGNPTDSGVKASDKLDAISAAPAFSTDSSVSYTVGSHCTHDGKLYVCTTATTGGTWVAGSWAEDTMTDPDAVLDITAQNQLRVVAKDGTLLWAQGYALASASSATLACDALNNFTFADGATSQAFALPSAPTGKMGDFGLDIDNGANTSAATMTFTGLDTTFSVVVPKGESLNDMLAIAAGELARFYITLTTFRVNNLPTWHIVKQVVENGGATA